MFDWCKYILKNILSIEQCFIAHEETFIADIVLKKMFFEIWQKT